MTKVLVDGEWKMASIFTYQGGGSFVNSKEHNSFADAFAYQSGRPHLRISIWIEGGDFPQLIMPGKYEQ